MQQRGTFLGELEIDSEATGQILALERALEQVKFPKLHTLTLRLRDTPAELHNDSHFALGNLLANLSGSLHTLCLKLDSAQRGQRRPLVEHNTYGREALWSFS